MLPYVTLSHSTYLEEGLIGVCRGSEEGADRKRRSKRSRSESRALDTLWYRRRENDLENEGCS